METDARKAFWIGCILVNQPTFFHERDWISMPADWSANIVREGIRSDLGWRRADLAPSVSRVRVRGRR